MLKEQRLKYILGRLEGKRIVTVAELCQNLDVSTMTIWRDLSELESQGLLRRVRGGALATEIDPDPTQVTFPNFDPMLDPHYDQKTLIGRYAAQVLVSDGDSMIVEAGTTTSSLVPFLHQSELTLLTNGVVTTMMAAQHGQDITIMCSGGILIDTGAFIGPQAEEFFTHFRVKKAFFSAEGFTIEDGFTDTTPLYSQLKNVMHQNADKIIMLIDSSKLGVRSLIQVMSLEEVDILVTDPDSPIDIVDELRQRGIEVHIVEIAGQLSG
jgi:DeoR/GlpR family transcriptional regulator of sugar metabolism